MFVFKCGEARGKGKTERKRKTVANRIIVLKKNFFFLKEKANEKGKKGEKEKTYIFLLVLLFLFSSANLFHSMEMKSSSSKDKQPDCASGRPSMRKGNKPLKASPDSSG